MKIISSPAFMRGLSGTIAALVLSASAARADTLFKENFNDLPYSNQEPIPTGPNQIDYGQWQTKLDEGSSALVTKEHAASGGHSLALSTGATGKSAVMAVFGSGESNGGGVESALRVRFSFYLSAGATAEAFVYDADQVLGYAQFVADGQEPYVRGWFDGQPGDRRERVATDAWYTVEFRLPENPGPESEYELRVWENGQSEPEEPLSRGKFYVPPTKQTSYRLLCVSNEQNESTLHLDDFLVETLSK